MRTKAIAFLFCLIGSIANAETFQLRKVMICDKAEIVFSKLASEFDEIPSWHGKDIQNESNYVVTINKKTGAWTLVQYDKDMACVMGVGTDSKLISEQSI